MPQATIRRAADYMLRRYGRIAAMRARKRAEHLVTRGDESLAGEWTRVAEAIDALAPAGGRDAQVRWSARGTGMREKTPL